MDRKELTVSERECYIFADPDPKCLLIRPFADHDEKGLDEEVRRIKEKLETPFIYVAFKINDWNKELTPWEADAAFGNERFGAGAKDTLAYIENDLIPWVKEHYPVAENLPVILGGYSLAGLFCLWTCYESDYFSLIASCSPSVWYPGWIEYAGEHVPHAKKVYLSLGKKEEKTKNRLMRTVGDCIKAQYEMFVATGKIEATLEWNEGNHFVDVSERMAKGFTWCMDRDIHTDALIYRTTVISEGMKLSEATVERVVDLQRRYQRQGHEIDFVDFLLDDENEVLRRCDEAERYLLTVTARRPYEDRV